MLPPPPSDEPALTEVEEEEGEGAKGEAEEVEEGEGEEEEHPAVLLLVDLARNVQKSKQEAPREALDRGVVQGKQEEGSRRSAGVARDFGWDGLPTRAQRSRQSLWPRVCTVASWSPHTCS